jgi:hypothetical protein
MTKSINKEITKSNSIAKVIDKDIVYIFFVENKLSIEKDIAEAYESYNVLKNQEPKKILFEVGQYSTMDKSARDYLEYTKLEAIAVGIVMHSLPQRIIYNFYINFRKQDHPLKAFKTKESALDWLNNL